jgi:hypothetical protein
MLTNSLGSTLLGQCLYPPGRGGVGQAAPFKDLRPPGPSGGRALCALSFQRHQDASPAPAVVSRASPRRPLPPLLSSMGRSGYSRAQSAGTSTVSAPRPSSLAFSPSALRRVRRLMQHSCGSAQSRTPPVLTSSPGSVRACSSKVRLRRASTWPLFLQALWPSSYADVLRRYRTHPLRSRVRRLHTPLASGHKAFRASRKQPFRLLAQTVSVIPSLVLGLRLHPSAVLPATDCAVIPLQRRCLLPLFEGQCLFAGTVLLRATVLPRSLLWAVPAQAGEAVCHPQRRSLPLFQGAQGLPSTALQSPPPPRYQTASPATLHFVPRPWSLTDSQAAPALMSEEMPATSPASTPPPARPSVTKANLGHTPELQCDIDRHLTLGGRKKGIYIYPRRQRLTPLRVLLGLIKSLILIIFV